MMTSSFHGSRSPCALVLLLVASACSSSTSLPDAAVDAGAYDVAASDTGASDAPATDMAMLDAPAGDGGGPVPLHHRPDDSACAGAPHAGTCTIGGGLGMCSHDSDCTSGTNGRCNQNSMGGPVFCACTYDTCQHDADCATGETCACHGTTLNPDANTCVPGDCRLDSDCGTGGYCSPSAGMAGCGGLAGYYCHTASDLCTNDTDCAGGTSGPRACEHVAASARWECVMLLLCA